MGSQPVQNLGKPPLGRIAATAPIECSELVGAASASNLLCLTPSPMVAPQVIVIEWLETLVEHDDRRPSGVECERFDDLATDTRARQRGMTRVLQGSQMI